MGGLPIERIDECLSVREGRLFVEDCDVRQLAQRFGTPLYVISEDTLRRNVRRFIHAFGERWHEGQVHVLASVKANFVLAVLNILAQEGIGCDTFGPGELHAALRSGFRRELISVNGSSKDRGLIEQAISAGTRITLDSVSEIALVRKVARSLGVKAQVRFRIRPRYVGLEQPSDFYEEPIPIRIAAQQYKPGIPTEDLLRIGTEVLGAPELEVTGVMAHLGRHSRDLGVWAGMVRSYVALLAELSNAWGGWEPLEIDLGGGFATRRDPTGRTTERGRQRPAGDWAPSIEEYADVLTKTLREELIRHGLHVERKTIEIEPGRSLFANAGIHLTTVRGVKLQNEPLAWRWIETDTSEMFLLDTLVEHCRWIPYLAGKPLQARTQTADIVGISCGFDVIVQQAKLPDAEPGEVVAFLDTGAYQDACSNNFNALPRPATVLVHDGEAELVKRAETVEDVFRRDIVPPRLLTEKRSGDGR